MLTLLLGVLLLVGAYFAYTRIGGLPGGVIALVLGIVGAYLVLVFIVALLPAGNLAVVLLGPAVASKLLRRVDA